MSTYPKKRIDHMRNIASTSVLAIMGSIFSHAILANNVTTIDFETPQLFRTSRQIIDPYIDKITGVSFTIEGTPSFDDAVVGLVTNNATSACVEPANNNQKLGTGRKAFDNGSIGLSAFPIRATFSKGLPLPKSVSVDIQSGVKTQVRLRLFDEKGSLIGSDEQFVTESLGTCHFPGGDRGKVRLTAKTTQGAAYAVVDLGPESSNHVFVIDNFSIEREASVVEVDCDKGESLNDAITTVDENGTVKVTGSCTLTEPLQISKGITIDGDNNGERTIIDGNGSDEPVITVDKAKNVIIKNVEVVNGDIGVLFKGKASGQLINVAARKNNTGMEFDERSYIKADEIIASQNRLGGINIKDSLVRFLNLNNTVERGGITPKVKAPTLQLFSLSAGISAGDVTAQAENAEEAKLCNVVASNNGTDNNGYGILVNANINQDESVANNTVARLEIDGCMLEVSDLNDAGQSNGSQSIGLWIDNAASAQANNSSIFAEGNSYAGINLGNDASLFSGGENLTAYGSNIVTNNSGLVGIYLVKDATVALHSMPTELGEQIPSTVVVKQNQYGIALTSNSALNLFDSTRITVDGNTYGAYVHNSVVTCTDNDSHVDFANNTQMDTFIFPFGVPELFPEDCR